MLRRRPRETGLLILLAISLGLPLALVLHSVYANRELHEMRLIFLRDRAATVAARLELMPPEMLERGEFQQLMESDPALLSVHVFGDRDRALPKPAADIRAGRELFRTELAGDVFRAWIPFHSGGVVRVAQIDLSAAAPDFILVHARHSALATAAGAAALLLLSAFGLWSVRRAARLERRQLETERMAELGRLSAVLAHEIRNPLGAIKGFAQLARESAGGAGAKALDAIVRESKRLENLVNSLLLYGRPLEAAIRPTRWDGIADDLEAHARQAIGARPIRFTAHSDLAEFPTDPDLLKPALLNLIRNSVEAIPEGAPGNVTLHAAPRAGGVVISVEDDGPGLPEKVRAGKFAPFLTTKASGTGLGLPIARKLVQTLGGNLTLSPADPRGTRAELVFHGTNSHH